jgi:hypothetical protein
LVTQSEASPPRHYDIDDRFAPSLCGFWNRMAVAGLWFRARCHSGADVGALRQTVGVSSRRIPVIPGLLVRQGGGKGRLLVVWLCVDGQQRPTCRYHEVRWHSSSSRCTRFPKHSPSSLNLINWRTSFGLIAIIEKACGESLFSGKI